MEAITVEPWGLQEGTPFSHATSNGRRIRKVTMLHEGGFKSFTSCASTETPDSTMDHPPESVIGTQQTKNLIKDPEFIQKFDDKKCWVKICEECTVEVISGSTGVGSDNANYVIMRNRKGSLDSILQNITEEVCVGTIYEVVAYVSVKGVKGKEFKIRAKIEVESGERVWSTEVVGSVLVKSGKWQKIVGYFHLSRINRRVLFCINGPPRGIDLCVGPVSIIPVTKYFVVNLDQDEYLTGTKGYYRITQMGMSEVLSSLTFLTNRTEHGPYGSEGGTFFSFKMRNGEITGFHGTCGNYLNSIGCHVKLSGSSMPVVNVKKDYSVGLELP